MPAYWSLKVFGTCTEKGPGTTARAAVAQSALQTSKIALGLHFRSPVPDFGFHLVCALPRYHEAYAAAYGPRPSGLTSDFRLTDVEFVEYADETVLLPVKEYRCIVFSIPYRLTR